jgi:hypothetical protein
VIRKIGRFLRTTGRSILGVKEKNDVILAVVRRQIDSLHVGIGQRKRWGSFSNL